MNKQSATKYFCATGILLSSFLLSADLSLAQSSRKPVLTPVSKPMAAKTIEYERELVFPSQFSLGRLYVYKDPINPHHFAHSKLVAESLGRFVGEARGVVKIKLPEHAVVYLVASYQLTEQPEVLSKLDANIVDCLSFASTGIMSDLTKTIKPLSHLTGLRYLDLSISELTDESLVALKSLTNLERLNLSMAGIDGTCLKELSGLKKLIALELTSNMLDSKAYIYLNKFQSLMTLHLNRCGVKDGDLAEISKMQNLRLLGLAQNLITAKGIANIPRMKSLSILSLTNDKLTTADLLLLKGSRLTTLNLPEAVYSPQDLNLLQRALPGTKLVCRNSKVGDYEKTLYGPLH